MIVPFTRAAVPGIDVAAGRLTVVPPHEVELREAARMTWRATVLTLFPDMFPGPLGQSLAGRALAAGLWSLDARDIRASAGDRHGRVDDTPFGGGAGMVMRPDVVDAALARVRDGRPLVYLTPRGRRLTQARVADLAAVPA